MKNAFDSAYLEWDRKPVAFVGYGGVGGARAIEQLRAAVIELQMAPLKHEVNIGFEPFLGVLQQGKSLDAFDYLVRSRDALFDSLAWWTAALNAGRSTPESRAA